MGCRRRKTAPSSRQPLCGGCFSSREVVDEIEAPLREHGYRIVGVSVEMVLVGGFENVPQLKMPRRKGKIPFDAQVWFRLRQF
jgi:hypothetical protein